MKIDSNINTKPNYSRLDHAIAKFLTERCTFSTETQENQKVQFRGIVRELSAALASGHSCISVSSANQQLLQDSGLVSTEGSTPLVLEGERLYLQRYWHYETRLAQQLSYKVNKSTQPIDNIESLLDKYFTSTDESTLDTGLDTDEMDWQRKAAEQVACQRFSIITGGPGTGKTTTVLKILALLQEVQSESGADFIPLSIALAAPTGKAAMRLQESIGKGKESLQCSAEIKDSITDSVSTIHRLLGAKPNSPYFRQNADNPLVHDLVVIDEASMVDLALMSKLVDALKPEARLILLGDKDQLASVESGSILGDLSQGLPECTTELKKSYRFKGEIKELALAINQQDKLLAWDLLQSERSSSTRLVMDSLLSHIMKNMQMYFKAIYKTSRESLNANINIEEVFNAYLQFKVLCSNRKGKLGVEGINASVERSLQHQGVNTQRPWYSGKPIIITRNNPSTGLFNGDIGICLAEVGEEALEAELYVYFQLADGSIRKLLPARLPQHETAYALTIHKSQGSEFEHILMVLPENPNPVLSKELVYTAITRAKETVEVYSKQEVFNYALSHQVERISGLKEKVAGDMNRGIDEL
ncbi:MAG: exodeoxyribonuclease V subunit alpha [Thiotrichaceae bacterium]